MATVREILDRGDLRALTALLEQDPALAVADIPPGPGHPLGAAPLDYVAMLRYDTAADIWRDLTGTGALARALLTAGAPANGRPGSTETPLMTAASYGDAEVAQVLVEAGADLTVTASATAGGVPGGTALMHAAVFGMTGVVDVLVRAGAVPAHLPEAAAVGDLSGFDPAAVDEEERVRALIMAADHQRIDVIDRLVSLGTPLEQADAWGRHPLRLAAGNGRPAAVRHLLELGADPDAADENGRTPLELARAGHRDYPGSSGHPEVIAILEALRSPR